MVLRNRSNSRIGAADTAPFPYRRESMLSKRPHSVYMRAWARKNPERTSQIAAKSYRRNRKKRLVAIASRYQTDPVYREYCKQKAREWRKAHPEWKRKRDGDRRAISKQFVQEYLRTHPCIDCGESDPACLDFDHRDPKKKRYCIGAGWASGILPKSIIKEIRKCDVRCSNCHRKKHAREHTQGKRIHA
jgi:hypothetical protein